LGQGVMLPAARLFNARFSPESGRSVEVEKATAARARGLFENEMAVEKHRLHAGEQGITAIQMAPARLNHPHFRIGKEIDRLAQQMRRWNEIGIENTNEFTARGSQPSFQGARFEAGAIDSMNQFDIETALTQFRCTIRRNLLRVIGRIVEHLDLQPIAWVIQLADRAQQPLHYINFVEDRQLHGHDRQLFESAGWHRRVFPILEKEVDNKIAVDAVSRKADEHAEVTDCPDE